MRTALLSKHGNEIKHILAVFSVHSSAERGWHGEKAHGDQGTLFYSIFNVINPTPPPFLSADFGDYNHFDSQDFLREYVLFPMVSVNPFLVTYLLPPLEV